MRDPFNEFLFVMSLLELPLLFISAASIALTSAFASAKRISPVVSASSCRDFAPSRERLEHAGDSIRSLNRTTPLALAARDSVGVYAALDTSGNVVAHDVRVWRDASSATTLKDILPSIADRAIPIAGIRMLNQARPYPDGRYVVMQWGLVCP